MQTTTKKSASRKIIYSIIVSLDGFVAGPNGELDWAVPDDELLRFINDQERELDTYLFGRRMYEMMVGWDEVNEDSGRSELDLEFARIWKEKLKIVFSSTLESVQENARLAHGDLNTEITRLKERPGKDVAIGGPALAAAAIERGLVDEYRLFVQPVILGAGKPCFPALDGAIKLSLVEQRTFTSGAIYLCYRPAE